MCGIVRLHACAQQMACSNTCCRVSAMLTIRNEMDYSSEKHSKQIFFYSPYLSLESGIDWLSSVSLTRQSIRLGHKRKRQTWHRFRCPLLRLAIICGSFDIAKKKAWEDGVVMNLNEWQTNLIKRFAEKKIRKWKSNKENAVDRLKWRSMNSIELTEKSKSAIAESKKVCMKC